jgi:hypothetical protein
MQKFNNKRIIFKDDYGISITEVDFNVFFESPRLYEEKKSLEAQYTFKTALVKEFIKVFEQEIEGTQDTSTNYFIDHPVFYQFLKNVIVLGMFKFEYFYEFLQMLQNEDPEQSLFEQSKYFGSKLFITFTKDLIMYGLNKFKRMPSSILYADKKLQENVLKNLQKIFTRMEEYGNSNQ